MTRPTLDRPVYLDLAPDAPQQALGAGLAAAGEAVRRSSWAVPFILGGLTVFALPHLVTIVRDVRATVKAEADDG